MLRYFKCLGEVAKEDSLSYSLAMSLGMSFGEINVVNIISGKLC
jgi:hypothetical protein